MRRPPPHLWIALGLASCIAACGTPVQRSQVAPLPAVASFERAQDSESEGILLSKDFSVPTHLRPCCAFGRDLEVDLSVIPVPLVALSNVLEPDRLGQHSYDGGYLSTSHGIEHGFVSREKNGLVYTCRGGFIDVAHVRDYADWTVFLARRIRATLDSGTAIELPEEGGRRFVFVTAVDREDSTRLGRGTIAAQLAQWLAYQLSLWHETVTWYGWSAIELFPERASAFSPEDLYSNLLGTMLASYLVQAEIASDEKSYGRAMDAAIADILTRLGAVPASTTRRALDAVDGLWWDSTARLPSERVVLRRSLSLGPEVSPWLIPEERVTRGLARDLQLYCGQATPEPVVLQVPEAIGELRFEDVARIDLLVGKKLRGKIPRPVDASDWLSQSDFDFVSEDIAEQCRIEFGVDHDRPGAKGSP